MAPHKPLWHRWHRGALLLGKIGEADLGARVKNRVLGDERLGVFEFAGYGDARANQTATQPDQSITADSIRRLVAANVTAFPHTQLVVTPQNPEVVRQLLADDVTKKLSAPVGIRSDCLGVKAPLPAWAESRDSQYVQTNDAVVNAIKQRLSSALVISEWCQLPNGTDPRSYYEKGLHDVVRDRRHRLLGRDRRHRLLGRGRRNGFLGRGRRHRLDRHRNDPDDELGGDGLQPVHPERGRRRDQDAAVRIAAERAVAVATQ